MSIYLTHGGRTLRVGELNFKDADVNAEDVSFCDYVYEIKHHEQQVLAQYQYLLDKNKCRLTERKFGQITERTALYRGENTQLENKVKYRNVEEYLQTLSEQMTIVIEKAVGPNLEPVI